MKKLLMLITAIAVMFGGLASTAPAAHADTAEKVGSVSKADSSKTQSKKAKKKCAKSTADTNAGGLTVLTTKVCIKADILKEMKCLAEAMKDEPVAPPRDPRAECKGKVVVNIMASIVTPPCPPGFFGGQAWLKIKIRQSIKVHALAVSIANGHVETMASFYIKLKDKVRGWSQSSCVEIPPPPPPPVDTPTYSCDTLSVTKGAGRSVTIGSFSTSQSGGATFKEAVIEWGDGSSNTYAAPVGKSHSYGADDTYTIKATAVFDVNGVEKRVTSSGCQSAVTFTPPEEEDNPPTMTCTVPEHIFVGDDPMWADFDLTDPDGDPASFNEPVLTGPIQKMTTDITNVPGGKRLSVKFSATAIPEGTSQSATISVTGQAGGKSVSCSGTVTVENNNTGW